MFARKSPNLDIGTLNKGSSRDRHGATLHIVNNMRLHYPYYMSRMLNHCTNCYASVVTRTLVWLRPRHNDRSYWLNELQIALISREEPILVRNGNINVQILQRAASQRHKSDRSAKLRLQNLKVRLRCSTGPQPQGYLEPVIGDL